MNIIGNNIAVSMGQAGLVIVCLLIAAIAYLLGSISFSIVLVRLTHHVDIRTLGSGNAGGTNVLRNFGPLLAFLTLLGDFGKGFVAVFIGREMFTGAAGIIYPALSNAGYYGALLAGMFCVLGHIKPIYFGFRGGKGVITSASILAFIDWRVFAVALGAFLIAAVITKTVSAGSIIGSCVFPFATYFFVKDIWIAAISMILAVWIIVSHKENIKRLLNGTESKISFKAKVKTEEKH